MRKVLFLILVFTVFIIGCNEPGNKKRTKREREAPTYTIGINLSLSGNGSYFTEEVKKGLELSFDYINNESERMIINAIYDDNKLNPKDAVTITKKFLEIDDVDLIISGYTPIIQATIGLVDQHGVPMLVTLSSVEEIAKPYKWAFRDFELESVIMPLMASYAYSGLEMRKGSWLVINDDMGADAVKFFSEKFAEEGGEMIKGEVFEASEMDLRNKINKVMANDPDFIIVIGRGSAMINACRQIRERDREIPILSNNTVDNDIVWEALGGNESNIWFPRPYTDLESIRYRKVNERFKEKYGHEMNWLNIYGVSIANYLTQGLRKSGGDKESMRNYLMTLNVPSLRGMLVMNESSDVNIPHEIFRRLDGKSIAVVAFEPAEN
ncbi:MAG: ABC transporter substrate-binding protein [Bacteroidales bacterium]|nr:ABC transporter substrate-binding protein [Bacteroidales bacterium]